MNTATELAPIYGHNSGAGQPKALIPSFKVITITPDMAREMVATTSRDIRPKDQKAVVDKYAQIMANQAWILNGNTVIFDEEGRLLDGLLRLTACIQADTPFRTVVARNIRGDTLHTIDQHRRRLYQGVIEARGVPNAGSVVRLMGKMIRIENGDFGLSELPISWSRYDRVLDSNPEIHTAVSMSMATRGNTLHSTARPALAFMALRAGKKSEITSFLRELGPNHTLGFESPPRMLAMQFTLMNQSGRAYVTDVSLALAILAFNDYCAGKKATSHYRWEPEFGEHGKGKRQQFRGQIRKSAPRNLGLPLVTDYPGLRNGGFDVDATTDDFDGQTAEDMKAAVLLDDGREEVALVTVTPELAREWLQFNTGNRKIQKSHIDAIKRDILAGNWMMNAQPICFTEDPRDKTKANENRLINGQHRLFAILAADVPVELPIAFNISADAFSTYDTQAKRTEIETRGRENRVDDRVVASAARLQWKEDNAYQLVGGKDGSPTTSELMETLQNHPGLMEAFPASRRAGMLALASAGLMTYFIYRITREDADQAEVFLKALETGEEIKAGHPVLTLRTTLLGTKKFTRAETIALLMEAWEEYKEWTLRKSSKASKAAKPLLLEDHSAAKGDDENDEDVAQPQLF